MQIFCGGGGGVYNGSFSRFHDLVSRRCFHLYISLAASSFSDPHFDWSSVYTSVSHLTLLVAEMAIFKVNLDYTMPSL